MIWFALVGLLLLAPVVALTPLVSLLWLVVSRGLRSLSWTFFTHLPAPVGPDVAEKVAEPARARA